MGILDEAIREHLDLKRQHGADDSELKQLEDEAFGPPGRPGDGEAADPAAEAPTEFLVQPGADEGEEGAAEPAEPVGRRELTDIQEPPATSPVEDDEPAEEEAPAAEHEAVPDAKPSAGGHTTAERHAIADQPTQHFDVEEELGAPETEAEEVEEEEDDDFFDEQRLSDELDQALEAPLETDEAQSEELEPEPESEEVEVEEIEEAESDEVERPAASHREEEEDVLEETPDFLEESPDDDQLWFEQKPPKDFDFDD